MILDRLSLTTAPPDPMPRSVRIPSANKCTNAHGIDWDAAQRQQISTEERRHNSATSSVAAIARENADCR